MIHTATSYPECQVGPVPIRWYEIVRSLPSRKPRAVWAHRRAGQHETFKESSRGVLRTRERERW